MSKPGSEEALYEQIAQYMNLKYPGTIYHFDLSGMWTPSHNARNLYGRLNRRAWPDFQIAKPTMFNGTVSPCAGLFLELKRAGNSPYLSDGVTLKKDWHVQEQAIVLDELRDQGYYAEFAVGYDQAIFYIDSYLHGPLAPKLDGPF